MTPDKITQEAEALARAQQRGSEQPDPPGPIADDNPSPGDLPVVTSPPTAPTLDGDPQPRVQRTNPKDDARSEITKRFRVDRDQVRTEDDNDVEAAMMQPVLPPEMQAAPEAPAIEEPQPTPAPAPAAATPAKHTLIVRGKEIQVSDDELRAAAQKTLAGDDYLEEAKKLLVEAKQVRRQDQPAQHPERTTQTQTEQTIDQPTTEPQHPEVNPYVTLVETLQFGDPQEAASKVEELVQPAAARTADTAAETVLARQRLRDESARTNKALEDFKGQHPELASDPDAEAMIERRLYAMQVEDMEKLGVTAETMPKTREQIAQWHLWYRSNGFKVRDVPSLLTTAKDEFVSKWSKGTPVKPAADPTKVEVTVDRSVRRAAIPQTPTRTVAPKPDAASQPAAQPRERSDIVQQMMTRRATPRGKLIAG